jgi:hypothetical protein
MAEQALYAPKADNNPWRILDMKTTEERLQIALWYPFSVRSLIELDGRWLEYAICSSRDNAYHVMKALSAKNYDAYYIVVQHFRYGKEGREKVILFAPNERQVKAALAKALGKDVKDL